MNTLLVKILSIYSVGLLFLFSSCSSATLIRTSQPDVKIYVDGEFKGSGEFLHKDAKVWGSDTRVRLEKDGCAPQTFSFTRNEEWDVLPCVGGVILIPLLWAKKYHPEHYFEYSCKNSK